MVNALSSCIVKNRDFSLFEIFVEFSSVSRESRI